MRDSTSETMATGSRTKIMSMTQRVSDWIALIVIWRRRSRDRQVLAAMSKRELQDIAMTPWEARCEAKKPFWRA